MAFSDNFETSRLVGMFTDPLNWALLVLATAFGYYVLAVPYWQDEYLKRSPQVMSLQEYMDNPSHPREWMLRTLGAPPPSVEIVVEGLNVKHVDNDSITLSSASSSSSSASGNCDIDPEIPISMGAEATAPMTDILVAGDNMDLLGLSVGQQVDLQVFGLHETDLGWVPLHPELDSDLEEKFTKDEIDELELLEIHVGGNTVRNPYVETGELRLAPGLQPNGEPHTLEDLDNDTEYIQTGSRLAGGLVDLQGVKLVDQDTNIMSPYFVVEDGEGRRANVYYNQRLLSEHRWGLDRLGDQCVVVRGVMRRLTPPELRQLGEDDNVQAVIDGHAMVSPDGSVVISLENPAAALMGR
ncbi:MAG TPA: hypothetical protein QGG30_06590 [Acidobacteriota bacterium]|jgi:hypothetical protein|nr:hypothetical protein [Acidobacteriota bacterium]MEC7900883.1 hypothetical protein [Acidobacteriota bacterium]HJO30136.1 hypothetical protein [Acidobacteriota bacterium]